MSNTTKRYYVLGKDPKDIANQMNAMYPNREYEHIHDVYQWYELTNEQRLDILFLDTEWQGENRALAIVVTKFFKTYIKDNPEQDEIDTEMVDKFLELNNMHKAKPQRKSTPIVYPSSRDFILDLLPTKTKDLVIMEADIDTPNNEAPVLTLRVMLPKRND